MYFYTPNVIKLPNDLHINVSHIGIGANSVDRIAFYDFFFSRKMMRLIGIGPAQYGLENDSLALRISIKCSGGAESKVMAYRINKIDELVFLVSEKFKENPPDLFQAILQFGESEPVKISIHTRINVKDQTGNTVHLPHDEVRLTLSTVQRNNRLVWIRDWILWHSRLFGIKRVLIYDNGSDHQEELIDMLNSLGSEVEVVFVYWPFPDHTPYAQRGSLNHRRMMFGEHYDSMSNPSYCMNLDVDEYLASPHGHRLPGYIDSILQSPFEFAVHIKERVIANVLNPEGKNCQARFFDYVWDYGNFGGSPDVDFPEFRRTGVNYQWTKYIFRFSGEFYCNVHKVQRMPHKITNHGSLKRSIYLIVRQVERRIWQLKRMLKVFQIEHPRPQYHMVQAPSEDIYFFHFQGLSDNWNERESRLPAAFNEKKHFPNSDIEELAHKAGLIDR